MKRMGCRRMVLIFTGGMVGLCLLLVGLAAVDNARLPRQSQTVDRLPPLEKARLAEALQLRRELGDEVLPGWAEAEIPVVVYNEAYAFLVAYPEEAGTPPDGWVRVPKGDRRGNAWEVVPEDDFGGRPYYRQRLASREANPQSFTVQVGAYYAATLTTQEWFRIALREQLALDLPGFLQPIFPYRLMVNLLLDSSDQYISLLLHESAHAYQGTRAAERLAAGEEANNQFQGQYPEEDEELRTAWKQELELLAKAMRASSVAESRALASEFLDLRQARRAKTGLAENLVDYERQREWVEGIGRYVEIESYRLAAETEGYNPAAELAGDPEFHAYQGYGGRWAREIDQFGRMADDRADGRFYYSGMAQAVLLDRLSPGWKDRLFKEGIWLEGLLTEAVVP